MALTEKEVTVASGEYPQCSDEELLARRSQLERRGIGRGVTAAVCFILMFVMLFAMGFSNDPELEGFWAATSAVLAFVFMFSFAGFAFSATEHGKLVDSLQRELNRRGIKWE